MPATHWSLKPTTESQAPTGKNMKKYIYKMKQGTFAHPYNAANQQTVQSMHTKQKLYLSFLFYNGIWSNILQRKEFYDVPKVPQSGMRLDGFDMFGYADADVIYLK